MNTSQVLPSRRSFLGLALGAGGVLTSAGLVPLVAEDKPAEIQPVDLAKKFVGASHSKIEEVKAMLADHPSLANAAWAWRGHDWETALGGASHMGRVDIADVLVEHGARQDIFWAAMTGRTGIVRSLVEGDAFSLKLKGPHGISLQFHAALSGDVEMATFLLDSGSQLEETTLRAAVQKGHRDMLEWLLTHGMKNVNQKDFQKRTLVQIAESRGDTEIVDLLRAHGAS